MNKKIFLVLISGFLVLFLSIGALMGKTTGQDDAYGYLSIFSNILQLVNKNYVEPVSTDHVMDSAVTSMVENLDPDSFFLKASDVNEYKKTLDQDQNAAGVGLTLSKRMGMVVVVSVDKGSSAQENKIEPGDSLRTVNDQYVQDLPIYKVTHLLKGPSGSTVTISLFESALEKPKELKLVRKAITAPYVQSYVVQPRIGYIAVRHLLPGVESEVEGKLSAYKQQGIDRLILDLRGCTEPNQDEAVKVAELFVGAAPIVQISGRTGTAEKLNGKGQPQYKGDLLVLTDGTTAGASEIVAGAIQDSGLGKTFGTRTFGRGGIQKLIPAGDNFLVLTTQKYLTPKGRVILNNGIEPSIPYKPALSDESTEDTDLLLNQAIDYLKYPAELEKAA